jgi:hypothetical protein
MTNARETREWLAEAGLPANVVAAILEAEEGP